MRSARPASRRHPSRLRQTFCAACVVVAVATITVAALTPDVLTSISAIPPEIAGAFREVASFQSAAAGQYYVFDRRSHTVFGVDAAQTKSWRIVEIGAEPGRIIDPTAFSAAADGTFVVADAPNNRERIQIFSPTGSRLGGFLIRGRYKARVMLNGLAIGGIGSLEYTGHSILVSDPDTGGLIAEYSPEGNIERFIGTLRHTGHEDDRALHLALNSGLPLVDPTGGFFFVFQTGEPVIRKYDASGALQFEQRLQGREIDPFVASLPTTWTRRQTSEGELPLVTPTVRSAAVDPMGRLWVSFVVPYTYVYDAEGDKVRIVQFRGTGIGSPASMFFDKRGRLLTTPGLFEFQP
jgi:hypothetical protein